MLLCQSEVKLVAQHLQEKTGKMVLTKDLHNLRTNSKRADHKKKSEQDVMKDVLNIIDDRKIMKNYMLFFIKTRE